MGQFRSGKAAVACFVVVLTPIAVPAQVINTVAGGGPNGVSALSANLKNVWSVAFDKQGNLFSVSPNDYRVYRVDSTGNLTVFAGIGSVGFCGDGGPATSACFAPSGLSVDSHGNVFIADAYNAIREVSAGTGIIQTVVGQGTIQGFSGDGGPATGALLFEPMDVCVDSEGNLFIADTGNDVVREVLAATGVIETIAGQGGLAGFAGDGGLAKAALLYHPSRLAVDSAGNLFIADTGNHVIREVVASSGKIQTVAGVGTILGFSGDGGTATSALLNSPFGVTIDVAGNIFIADTGNSVVREVSAATHTIQTIAGKGQTNGYSGDGGNAANALLAFPAGVTLDSASNIFISDSSNNVVREIAAATGTIKTIAGNGYFGFSGDGRAATVASLQNPSGIFVDSTGDLFIADALNAVVREVSAETGAIQTVAGTPGKTGYSGDGGDPKEALLYGPSCISLDVAGNLFIVDGTNRVIRKVDQGTGKISTVAGGGSATCPDPAVPNANGTTGAALGDGGPATSATLCSPGSISLDKQGNLYIPDEAANLVREVFGPNSTTGTPGNITSIAGTGTRGFNGDGGLATMAELSQPTSVAVDGARNVFIADSQNETIREVMAATGTIRTVAGVPGTSGYSGDGGLATSAMLDLPSAVSLDAAGDLFILDTNNNVVRVVAGSSGIIQTIVGQQRTSTGYLNPGFGEDGGAPTSAFLDFPRGLFVDDAGNIFIADTMNERVREVSSALAPTFALSAQSLALTVPRGAQTTDVLTITPMFGAFNSAISLTCSIPGTGAPACSILPGNTVPGAQDTSLILTVQADSMASFSPDAGGRVLTLAYAALLPVPLFILFVSRRGLRRNKLAAALTLCGCVIFLACLTQAGCSGGSQSTVPPPPITYTAIVTASSASVTRTVSINVTVQ